MIESAKTRWVSRIEDAGDGDGMVVIPDEIVQALGLAIGSVVDVEAKEIDGVHVLVMTVPD